MISTADLDGTRVGFSAEVNHLEVIHNERVAAGTFAEAHRAQIGDAADSLGELEVEVGSKDDFVLGLVLDAPGGHDEGVVLSENDDAVDALGLEGVDLLDVGGNVIDVARSCDLTQKEREREREVLEGVWRGKVEVGGEGNLRV